MSNDQITIGEHTDQHDVAGFAYESGASTSWWQQFQLCSASEIASFWGGVAQSAWGGVRRAAVGSTANFDVQRERDITGVRG